MVLVGGCDPGGPGHGVPAPNDVDDGGEARGDADGQAHRQEVAMVPEHKVSRGVTRCHHHHYNHHYNHHHHY